MKIKPKILHNKPEPQIRQRLYNGRKIVVWEGKVKTESINGWIDNPRIQLDKKKYLSQVGQREITQDEIYEIMKNSEEVKLKELRDDIIKNGLREPLALSYSGKLLDGNRRFFAIKYALSEMPKDHPNRQDLETVDVYILTQEATQEDEQNVLVEENFSASLKIEWPAYVKAIRVKAEADDGLSVDEISKKYNWTKTKIKETLKIHEIIDEFMNFATAPKDPSDEAGGGMGMSEQEAENLVAKNYQYFNEAHKSFFEELKKDFEFKINFFRWICACKFSSFSEVRVAYRAWNHPEAKAVIMQPDPTAAKSAKAILDYNDRVVRGGDELINRIGSFIKTLQQITASDLKAIPAATRKALTDALSLVIKLSKAASE